MEEHKGYLLVMPGHLGESYAIYSIGFSLEHEARRVAKNVLVERELTSGELFEFDRETSGLLTSLGWINRRDGIPK